MRRLLAWWRNRRIDPRLAALEAKAREAWQSGADPDWTEQDRELMRETMPHLAKLGWLDG